MARGGRYKMAELSTRSLGSDVVLNCDVCEDDGKMVEAEGLCVNCGEYLCGVCYTSHQRTRQTRHHQLLDKDNLYKDTQMSSDRINEVITTKCKMHSDKLVQYYCKTHNILTCSTCFVKEHMRCEFRLIIEESANILDGQEYTDFITTLKSIDRKSRDIMEKASANITQTTNCHSEVINSIKLLRKKVNNFSDELEQEIVTVANTVVSEEEKKMANISNMCSSVAESTGVMLEDFKNLQSSRRVCQVYISMKESSERIKTLLDKLRKAEETLALIPSRIFKLEVKTNRACQDTRNNPSTLRKNSREVHGITEGQCTENSKPIPERGPRRLWNYSRVVLRITENPQTEANKPVLGEIEHVKDISLSDVEMSGFAVLSSTRLLAIANVYSKTIHGEVRVILVDTQTNRKVSLLLLSGLPLDVSVISKTKAAVTLTDKQKIILLNVSDLLEIDREITVSGACCGVAYGNNNLVVSYKDPPKLEIMDLSGELRKRIVKDSEVNQFDHYSQSVCVSKDGDTIYASICASNKVISLSFDGVVKSVYSDSELRDPFKVCVDHHGNVYVGGNKSSNVHMLTADLAKIKIILTKDNGLNVTFRLLSYCQETNRLYVGMRGKIVKVFQLS